MTKRLLRILGLTLALLCFVALAQAQTQIPVTGHLFAAGSNPTNPTIYQVQFTLAYCGANQPKVFDVGTINASTATFTADSNGLITGNIWPNDVITCGGTMAGTRYNVSYLTNGSRVGPVQCFQVLSSVGTFNLDTAQPCTQVPPPPPPPGFGDYEFHNLTLSGLLVGTSANFTGDVTALTFHFATAGAHSTCGSGQVANQLNQDFTLGCVAQTTSPVTSVFTRTGNVTAQSGDYSFSLISGTIADSQFQAITHVYPIQVTEATHLTSTPTQSSCGVTSGQALSSLSIDNAANIACGKVAIPTSFAEAVTITTVCSGTTNNCICTPGSSATYDLCEVNISAPVAFPNALDGATANCVDQPISGGSPSAYGSALCNVLSGNPAGVTVVIQNNRSTAANPATLFVTMVGH